MPETLRKDRDSEFTAGYYLSMEIPIGHAVSTKKKREKAAIVLPAALMNVGDDSIVALPFVCFSGKISRVE